MEQEETAQLQLGDEGQLLVEALPRLALVTICTAVALVESAVADARELDVGGVGPVGEVRVAVAELLREVELEPLGELDGARDGVAVVGETVADVRGVEQDALAVSSAFTLAALERGAVLDRHERVLERRSRDVMRVRVSGDDGRDAECLGEVAKPGVPTCVASLVRALELDVEAVAPEGGGEPGGRVRVVDAEAVTCAARQADEALVELLEQRLVERRRQQLGLPAR